MTSDRLDEDEQTLLDCYLELKPNWTRKERFNLGMFVASRFLIEPGQFHSDEKLAAFCGISRQAIEHIRKRGLRKSRRGRLLVVAKEFFPNGVNGH